MIQTKDPRADQVRMYLEKYHIRNHISREICPQEIEVVVEDILGDMVIQLNATFLGKKKYCHEDQSIELGPLNWWHHLKQRWFSAWALKRWPVKTRSFLYTHQTTEIHICPHIDTKFRDNRGVHYAYAGEPMDLAGILSP